MVGLSWGHVDSEMPVRNLHGAVQPLDIVIKIQERGPD